MGTLFDQPPRGYCEVRAVDVDDFLDEARTLSVKHDISVRDVITAIDVLERRRENNLRVRNGDAFDEQIGGLGSIFQQAVDVFDRFIDVFNADTTSAIARAIDRLGTGNAADPMGAIEFLATKLDEGAQRVAEALGDLADAVRESE